MGSSPRTLNPGSRQDAHSDVLGGKGCYAEAQMPLPNLDLAPGLERALSRQANGDDHDAGLIVERLAWTPEERLKANESFLRFYAAARPSGPLTRED